MSDILRTIAKVTAPLASPLAGRRLVPVWAVVEHRGRRSGTQYRTPVAIGSVNGHVVIPVPFGENTQWVKNVVAAGGCDIRWKGRIVSLTDPAVVHRHEAERAFNRLERPILGASGMDRFLRLRIEPGQPAA